MFFEITDLFKSFLQHRSGSKPWSSELVGKTMVFLLLLPCTLITSVLSSKMKVGPNVP